MGRKNLLLASAVAFNNHRVPPPRRELPLLSEE
jgi:hypothetical protein